MTTNVVIAAEESFPKKPQTSRARSDKQTNRANARLTLPEAVQQTLNRNPRIGEALARIRQRVWQQQQVYSDFFPSAALTYRGTWYRYSQGGRDFGPPDHMSRFDPKVYRRNLSNHYPYRIDPWKRFKGSVEVIQPIYQGGRTVASYDAAKLSVLDSQLQVQVDRQDLILEVYRAYYSMMLGEKLLEVNGESISNLDKLKTLNEKFLQAGTVTKTDVLSTQTRLYGAYVLRREYEKILQSQRAILNNLLSNPPETPIQITQDYKQRSNPYRIPAIYNTAMGNRDEIFQATNLIRKAMEAIKVADSNLLPKAELVAQGSRTSDDWNVVDPEGANDWTLTGVLTWTFNMFKSNSAVKEKREVVDELVLARQRLVQNISQNVKIAYVSMKTSEGNIDDLRRAVGNQTENFRLFQMRYQQGDVSFTDVLIAEDTLVLSKAEYYKALIEYRINQAVLEREMGILRR